MAEQWMSIVEYSRSFSVSDMTVRRRIKNGKLHAVLKDGKYFIPVDQNSAALQATTVHPKNPPALNQSASDRVGAISPQQRARLPIGDDDHEDVDLPFEMKSRLLQQETGLVDTRALLSFCESSLVHMKSLEKHIHENYKNKFTVLEEKLRYKELEVSRLKQQVEDLQTLIHMMESSS